MTRRVASTSSVATDSSLPARISATAVVCTLLCWRTSSSARWNPKDSTLPDQVLQLTVCVPGSTGRGEAALDRT
jgi:hypothetical protein